MLYVKYALFFLALSSISSAAVPIAVNDDGNQGLLNGLRHPVEKRVNPEEIVHSDSSEEEEPSLGPGFVYILKKKKGTRLVKVPIICLGPVLDENSHPIPEQFNAIELVKSASVPSEQLNRQYGLGSMQPASRYFDAKHASSVRLLKTKLAAYSVEFPSQQVNERDIGKMPYAEVSDEGLELLRNGGLQGSLFIQEKKDKTSVKIPVIYVRPVPDEHGYFYAAELVKAKLKQQYDHRHLGDMRRALRYFDVNPKVVGRTRLSAFSVKLSLQKVNKEDIDPVSLAHASPAGWQKLLSDHEFMSNISKR